jgi:hypothetical protein
MPSLLSIFERIFSSNEVLTFEDDAPHSIPITAADPLPYALEHATQHSHVVTIMDFMQQDQFLRPWVTHPWIAHPYVVAPSNDPMFQLNSIVISYS